MVSSSLLFAFLALLFWGLWTFSGGHISDSVSSGQVMLYIAGINGMSAVLYVYFVEGSGFVIDNFGRDSPMIVLTGLFSTIGGIAFYEALRQSGGNTGVVITITSLYFVVGAVLTVAFTEEVFSVYEATGIGLIVVGTLLMTYNF